MNQQVLHQLQQNKQKKLAVLIDPDSLSGIDAVSIVINHCNQAGVDLILVGGSLITNGFWNACVSEIKKLTSIPVVLFPGNLMQTHDEADAILFLSMISGRNPDLLIGKHVLAAPGLKKSGVEVIPTAYMIVDGGKITSVMYMSNTTPIPHDKNNIAVCTAMAGEMLGLKVIYMDAGSGANHPISKEMVKDVKSAVDLPVFVGGGIRTAEQAVEICQAGADVVVVGNAIESNPSLVYELCKSVHALNAEALAK
ncbi:MAG: geranylgeranylglyceryl/heptaprenylglyceryl phosphate synthase [Bacteroidia bacterium]